MSSGHKMIDGNAHPARCAKRWNVYASPPIRAHVLHPKLAWDSRERPLDDLRQDARGDLSNLCRLGQLTEIGDIAHLGLSERSGHAVEADGSDWLGLDGLYVI